MYWNSQYSNDVIGEREEYPICVQKKKASQKASDHGMLERYYQKTQDL